LIKHEWLELHYPPYWRYDILQALRVLSQAGELKDPRMRGLCAPKATTGLRKGRGTSKKPKTSNEVVDWGRSGPNEMITLNAFRVLEAAWRIY
jgi:hypothetical protein